VAVQWGSVSAMNRLQESLWFSYGGRVV